MKKINKSGFSLMEMMIVLLIVAIVAAATVPLVTRKVAMRAGSGAGGGGPITWLNMNDYGNTGKGSLIVGINKYLTNSKTFINSNKSDQPQLGFGTDGTLTGILAIHPTGRISFGGVENNLAQAKTDHATAIGSGAVAEGQGSIAIGNISPSSNGSTNANGADALALGSGATANGTNSVAIGPSVTADEDLKLVLGASTHNVNIPGKIASINAGDSTLGSTTINGSATINGDAKISNSLTAGSFKTNKLVSTAGDEYINIDTAKNSVAIGKGATTDKSHVIVLGTSSSTVYIPGDLIVNKSTILGYLDGKQETKDGAAIILRESGVEDHSTYKNKGELVRFNKGNGTGTMEVHRNAGTFNFQNYGVNVKYESCDRRLKNVGEKFTAGLEQVKKLDLYNFTFKADKDKTPQVGVMAQDLQKIFPTAVWKGDDGYLRIRWDEMFYAVINAVKELDTKVTTAFEQIKANTDKVTKLQAQVDEQQKVIADLEKRLAKLEKKEK